MFIEVFYNGDMRIMREAMEHTAQDIEDLVDKIVKSPNHPCELELAPDEDAIDEFTHGMFESRSCAVTFIIDGKRQGNIINDSHVQRYNAGLDVLLPSCNPA